MKDKNKAVYFLILIIVTSCAHYSTTQQNIKKVNDVFEVKKDKNPSPVAEKPAQDTTATTSSSIPLSQFLDAKTPMMLQSINPWFSKLQDWSKVYLDIAKAEKDVRNHSLSAKYSHIAVVWAHRALQIKDLPSDGAVFKVRNWVDQIQWPDLPETSGYFLAEDVYAKIYITRNTMGSFKNRFCLISSGIPIIPSLAYLDLSIDLFKQKNYSKALYKIQNALASVENLKPEDDLKCEENLANKDTDSK